MSKLAKTLQAAAGNAGGGGEYVEDVFSTYLYKGNDSVKNIVNGIDLAGEGGLVWIKNRLSTTNHALYDTERGVQKYIRSNTTEAQGTNTAGTHGLTSFNSDGFTLGDNQFGENSSSYPLASWTFRKSPNFFDVVTWTGDGTGDRVLNHNLDTTVGCAIVKNTTSGDSYSGNWSVHHRSLGLNQSDYLCLNLKESEGQNTYTTGVNPVSTSTNTTVTIRGGGTGEYNKNGVGYVAYLFAHEAGGFGEDGEQNVISCGSYTGNGGTQEINLGWEPQWVLLKTASQFDNWWIVDSMRGLTNPGTDSILNPNGSNAEIANAISILDPTATGFINGYPNSAGETYIYIAIRRPMKTPESGTEVFSAVLADGISEPLYNTTFPVDMALARNYDQSSNWTNSARLIQGKELNTDSAGAEFTSAPMRFDYQDGWSTQGFSSIYISYNFKRSTGFFDVVAYTGTGVQGTSVTHNLGVTPELIICKGRTLGDFWPVYSAAIPAQSVMALNANVAPLTNQPSYFPSSPTSTVFNVGSNQGINGSGLNYIAYLFATLPGISKVGSYTGTGADLNVDCGFSAGARFILIKRTDSTGDWYVWDTTRGIVAGNDPYLLLNRSDQQVTGTDYIDPLSSGFTVTSSAPAALNASGGTYIFLAIA